MFEIQAAIKIKASKETIWRIFTAFEQYPEWNPFIRELSGVEKPGSKFFVELGGMKFRPQLLEFRSNEKMSWIGHLLFPGIFDGQHSFELQEQADGSTLFVQRERFKGILVPLLKRKLNNDIKKEFEAMNEALRKRAEELNSPESDL